MKKNYEDQKKMYQKIKKEFTLSQSRTEDIKLKLAEFQKPNEKHLP